MRRLRKVETEIPSAPWSAVFKEAPFSVLLASFFGIGFLPGPSGTWGSAAVIPLAEILVRVAGPSALAAFGLIMSLLGVYASNHVVAKRGVKDPGQIVVDEVAGQTWALLGIYYFLPPSAGEGVKALLVFAAFLLFRILDIFKPGPIRSLEKLPAGLGVMADDIASGLVAGVTMAVLSSFVRW